MEHCTHNIKHATLELNSLKFELRILEHRVSEYRALAH